MAVRFEFLHGAFDAVLNGLEDLVGVMFVSAVMSMKVRSDSGSLPSCTSMG
jgi:hypothetical protein